MTDEPSFDVPTRPQRRYPPTGGVEYEGATVFHLTPDADRPTDRLDETLQRILDDDRYVRGDFFDLPAPAYLVRDGEVGTSFRAVVRTGRVELHVLPHTDTAALEVLYERLAAESDVDWTVECHADRASGT